MANTSITQGSLRISVETDSLETFKRAVRLIDSSLAYRNTEFLNTNNVKKDGTYLTVDDVFNGKGEGTYETNIDNFGRWLDDWLDSKCPNNVYPPDYEDRAFLENLDFNLHYYFVDYKPDSRMLYEAEAVNYHQAGSLLSETMTKIINKKDIDFTLDNVYEIGLEDIDTAIDFNQPRKDIKNFFVENFKVDLKLFEDEKTYQAIKNAFGDEWIFCDADPDYIKETINTALEKEKAEKAEKDELER